MTLTAPLSLSLSLSLSVSPPAMPYDPDRITVEAGRCTFGELLPEGTCDTAPLAVTIPLFQRRFCWTEKHVETLFRDVQHLSEVAKQGTRQGTTHPCGSIHVYRGRERLTDGTSDEGINTLEVIDGQQRLTCVTTMLCAGVRVAREVQSACASECGTGCEAYTRLGGIIDSIMSRLLHSVEGGRRLHQQDMEREREKERERESGISPADLPSASLTGCPYTRHEMYSVFKIVPSLLDRAALFSLILNSCFGTAAADASYTLMREMALAHIQGEREGERETLYLNAYESLKVFNTDLLSRLFFVLCYQTTGSQGIYAMVSDHFRQASAQRHVWRDGMTMNWTDMIKNAMIGNFGEGMTIDVKAAERSYIDRFYGQSGETEGPTREAINSDAETRFYMEQWLPLERAFSVIERQGEGDNSGGVGPDSNPPSVYVPVPAVVQYRLMDEFFEWVMGGWDPEREKEEAEERERQARKERAREKQRLKELDPNYIQPTPMHRAPRPGRNPLFRLPSTMPKPRRKPRLDVLYAAWMEQIWHIEAPSGYQAGHGNTSATVHDDIAGDIDQGIEYISADGTAVHFGDKDKREREAARERERQRVREERRDANVQRLLRHVEWLREQVPLFMGCVRISYPPGSEGSDSSRFDGTIHCSGKPSLPMDLVQ
ncbi:hypothetical protein KIPB_002770 [Kipferlia bialata]|uniref:GmrSD restriction endonucleases N-terminal domain-containing protein n=1 Tax=Kipferlia bialata TaxID=797122 RepID=A0A9K3CR60_9EUKA|nr:hypothetical protein KIPB_002770 [Kipferlia bialata]|eukprot:g2770.t1